MGRKAKPFDEIRRLTRAGRFAAARSLIEKLSKRKLDRQTRVELAYLANEAVFPSRAASLVYRAVTGAKGLRPTDAELLEYGRALVRLGAVEQAIKVLGRIDRARLPRVAIYLSFAHFRRWGWVDTLEMLEEALANRRLTPGERVRVLLYLGTALLHGVGDFRRAEAALNACFAAAKKENYREMQWQALQGLAQSAYLQGQFTRATELHGRMREYYADDQASPFALIQRFWALMVSLKQDGPTAKVLGALRELQGEFRRAGIWQYTRGTDYYLAQALGDRERAIKLYFGSPYGIFRRRLVEKLKLDPARIPETYSQPLELVAADGGADVRSARETPARLDSLTGVLSGSRRSASHPLKPGQALHRLLTALTTDFYADRTLIELHEAVNPDEIFNPTSSPVKMRQLIKRFRQWLKAAGLPLELHEQAGLYRLLARRPVSLVVRRPSSLQSRHQSLVETLGERFGGKTFNAAEVEPLLGCSRWQAVALLRELCVAGLAAREGAGPSTCYRLQGPAIK